MSAAKKMRNDLTPVEIAMSEPEQLAESFGVPLSDATEWTGKAREFMHLWSDCMDDDLRRRMDPAIIERFQIQRVLDMPRDTALLRLRDFINQNYAPPGRYGIAIESGHPEPVFMPNNPDRTNLGQWVVKIVTEDIAFRLCKQCGKPFAYKSQRAMYCSAACRVAASRSNK